MIVAAALNGQIASEGAALYAMKTAGALGYALELVHAPNPSDDPKEVEASMANVEEAAARYGVEVRRFFPEGEPFAALGNYMEEREPEILFCGTRVRNRIYADSMSQRLVKSRPKADLAIVRTLHVGAALTVDRALLPIREDRMSPEKFAFFAALLKGYEAEGEVYSVTPLHARKRSRLDVAQVRGRLEQIDRRLSHYSRLAELAGLTLKIKHAFTGNEADQILHHLHHYGYQLMVLGGRRPLFPLFGSDPAERLLEATPVNTIVFYPRDGHSCFFSN